LSIKVAQKEKKEKKKKKKRKKKRRLKREGRLIYFDESEILRRKAPTIRPTSLFVHG